MAVATRFALVPVALVATLVLAACGGGAAAPHPGDGQRTPIRVSLDWTPNTNHTGLFVAQQEGWFDAAGLDVEFLPYNNTPPDTLVGSGAADFGISFQDSFTYAKASGVDAVSVMAITQHWTSEIAVRHWLVASIASETRARMV